MTDVWRPKLSVTWSVAEPLSGWSPAANDSVGSSVTVPEGRVRPSTDHEYVYGAPGRRPTT